MRRRQSLRMVWALGGEAKGEGGAEVCRGVEEPDLPSHPQLAATMSSARFVAAIAAAVAAGDAGSPPESGASAASSCCSRGPNGDRNCGGGSAATLSCPRTRSAQSSAEKLGDWGSTASASVPCLPPSPTIDPGGEGSSLMCFSWLPLSGVSALAPVGVAESPAPPMRSMRSFGRLLRLWPHLEKTIQSMHCGSLTWRRRGPPPSIFLFCPPLGSLLSSYSRVSMM
mmetsp:Transcript_53230/g.150026  ORF Transcript_53230/g.150026 Transcript_53230/m.150026 type:complete len:226 (+) Transcript_53230:90-767(+)